MLSEETLKHLHRKGIDPKLIGVFTKAWELQKTELNEKVFILFMTIAINVLAEDEFFGMEDEGKKKIEAFKSEVVNLLDAVSCGATKWKECCDLMAELTGETIDLDLLPKAGIGARECLKEVTQ